MTNPTTREQFIQRISQRLTTQQGSLVQPQPKLHQVKAGAEHGKKTTDQKN